MSCVQCGYVGASLCVVRYPASVIGPCFLINVLLFKFTMWY
jgi:hypothetical protein